MSNDTLEELASHLFQRACVSMDELKHVDDMLTIGKFGVSLYFIAVAYLCSLFSVY